MSLKLDDYRGIRHNGIGYLHVSIFYDQISKPGT